MRVVGIVPVRCPRCDQRQTFSDWEWQQHVDDVRRAPDEDHTIRCRSCYQSIPTRLWQVSAEQEAIKRAGFVTPRMQKEQRA